MTFSNTPRVCLLFCWALSVAGQWTGNYNMTTVPRGLDPAEHCLIQSLVQKPHTNLLPCVCTGGKVAADCNWWDYMLHNSVRDATCKCEDRGQFSYSQELEAFARGRPYAVRDCMCDPATPKGEPGTDGFIVPSGNCWCSASSLKVFSELTEAEEVQAAPETPAPIDAAAVQKCRDDFLKTSIIKKSACDQLAMDKTMEFSGPLKRLLPNCTIALLTEVCKTVE